MISNSKLEELKKQVRDTSDQQLQIQGRRDRIQEIVSEREELELDYQNQKEALQGQIKSLEERLESRKMDLESLKKEISTNTSKLEEIVSETQKATFKSKLKKSIDKIGGQGAMPY